MEEFQPWTDYPGVTAERLTVIAGLIKKARAGCAALHDPDSGDNAWSLGCRAYARSLFELRAAAQVYDWLTILPEAMELRLTFAIAGRPIRFYRGDVTTVPAKYLSATVVEQLQIDLFDDLTDASKGVLRLAVLTNTVGEVLSIRLVEFDNLTKLPMRSYDVSLPDDAAITPIAAPTPGVVLPPVTVAPISGTQLENPQIATATGTSIDG